MGQATRRELALGLRSAEASLAATRGRSRWRRGGAGGRETQRRAVTAGMLRSLVFNTSPQARHAGGQPSPAGPVD